MKVTKRLIYPDRVRRVPQQFSWVDQRLVRDGHIRRSSACALGLYLFLVTVGDSDGLSYYSDRSVSEFLSIDSGVLATLRRELVAGGLIAYQAPLYQVLGFDTAQNTPPRPTPSQEQRRGESRLHSVAEILGEVARRR